MKKLILGATGLVAVLQAQAQLVVFNFDGSAGNEAAYAPAQTPAGAQVSEITRGSGLAAAASAQAFSASGWSTGPAPDANDYYAFSITPDLGLELSLTSLTLDERRSASGIREWSVRASLDGFGADLGCFQVPDNTLTRYEQASLLGPEFAHLSGAVEFRIYGYAAEAGPGTWRVDNVALDGAISAVPEPSSYALVFGLGLIGFACVDRFYFRRKPAVLGRIPPVS